MKKGIQLKLDEIKLVDYHIYFTYIVNNIG